MNDLSNGPVLDGQLITSRELCNKSRQADLTAITTDSSWTDVLAVPKIRLKARSYSWLYGYGSLPQDLLSMQHTDSHSAVQAVAV